MMEDFSVAVRLHRADDLDGAEAGYRQILAREPDHADALHLLGVLEHQRGHNEAAIEGILRAIRLIPGRAHYHNNLGVAYRALARLEEAVASHREALRMMLPAILGNYPVQVHRGPERGGFSNLAP